MVFRRAVFAAALLAAAPLAAGASPISDRARRSHDRPQEVLAAAGVAKVRDYADVSWQQPPAQRRAAWDHLLATSPGLRFASWDTATGVPSRIYGRGVDVPGSVADPAIAEAAAWRFLAEHLALLAPGAGVGDFELVANVSDGDLRTIGMIQRHAGLAVVGGQVSFRFKRDRLFVIGSEALPDVTVAWPHKLAAFADVDRAVAGATVADLGLDPATVTTRAATTPVILPLIGERGVLGYRLAVAVDVDAGSAGGWRVWADPMTGAPLVRRSTTPSAVGAVAFDAVERWTGRPRRTYPSPRLTMLVNGGAGESDAAGRVTWTGTAPASLTLTPTGPLVTIVNMTGDVARQDLTVSPDGTAVWHPGADAKLDAQVSGFIHGSLVKEYVRRFAPRLEFLDEQLEVKVNIDDECNAFSNGTAIHFFNESERCVNTATIADVVYHEFGHSMHAHSLIPGAGFFDGAFSEGLSDYLAITMTGDPGMGRGFFKSDAPLRDIDPVGTENIWPRDIDEIHRTGMIFAGAMWDLREGLAADLGREPGVALADRLFYAAVQRAPSIPATLVEILAADDDDGDLSNGTPHECAIRAAFGRHGLRTALGHIDAPGSVASDRTEAQPVTLRLEGLDTRCGDTVSGVKLEWKPRGGGPTAGAVAATASDAVWSAELPLPMDGFALFFRFRVQFADMSEMVFPDNRADPWYQFYHGDVVPLYCTDFEANPFDEGWRAGGDSPEVWQWGTPGGNRGVGDPGAAFSGQRILGTGLSFAEGGYTNDTLTWVESPVVDVGHYSDVRLQYRRWLNVEDGFYDQASIEINGEQAWANLSSQGNSNHTTHHEDKAWLFQDLPLSSRIFDGTVAVKFLIDSDDSFELGGWNLDDFCIVANPRSVCGDGTKTGAEQCDDGAANADAADACRTNCRIANCGDGIQDSIEQCDDGNQDDTDGCNGICEIVSTPDIEIDGGCCSTGGGGPAGAAIGSLAVALGLLASRRRRVAH